MKNYDLTKQQVMDLIDAFELFDVDGGGSIGADELQVVLGAIGRRVSVEDVKFMIAEIEKKHQHSRSLQDLAALSGRQQIEAVEGELELDEFMGLMAEEMKQANEERDDLFQAFIEFGAEEEPPGEFILSYEKFKHTMKDKVYE